MSFEWVQERGVIKLKKPPLGTGIVSESGVQIVLHGHVNIVTYRVVRVTKMTGSSLDDWVY
jgi:hypothetical protein